MREHPILFSAPMVRAILDGRKSVTRRVMRPQPTHELQPDSDASCGHREWMWRGKLMHPMDCPYGSPGDRLWCRETWRKTHEDGGPVVVEYRADGKRVMPMTAGGAPTTGHGDDLGDRWRSPIHMPRWASRLTLRVTGVRVECVQEITEEDARAEGIEHGKDGWLVPGCPELAEMNARVAYSMLWDHINAKRGFGWDVNPWVWRIAFERVSAKGAT